MQQDKLHSVYVSSMVFGGKTYRGKVSGSKKDAEQLVARIAIESLLGSDSGILLQIITSKGKVRNGNSINQISIQRPVPVGPSSQAVSDVLDPSTDANDDIKRILLFVCIC